MIKLLTALILLFLCACTSKDPGIALYPILASGSATNGFYQGKNLNLGGVRVVDSSVVVSDYPPRIFVDWGDGQFLGSAGLIGKKETTFVRQSTSLNFTYVIWYKGLYYMFGEYKRNIYLQTSSNGLNWQLINNGKPVLTHSLIIESNWYNLWNVAVDVDSSGTWHLLVECSDNTPIQGHVGLCYSTAKLNGKYISFDANIVEDQVIKNAGNPYLKIVKGGMLIVHGQINEGYGPFDAQHWFITASTRRKGQNAFVTHQDKFSIGTPGIHDCDPHLAEVPGKGLLMLLSVDQSHITTLWHDSQTLQGLFNALK